MSQPTRPSALSRLRSSFKASLKSMDTEEWIDVGFYRPLGYIWACIARRLGVSPNAITVASIFLGVGAGVAFYFDSLWINVAGIILLIWANSFDSADGQLARMTASYSRLGRILDGLSGDLWFAAIYIAICLREVHTDTLFGLHHWIIWVLAAAAGLCHAKQAALADYYRQFHLYFLKGEQGSELEDSADLRSRLAAMPRRGNFWSRTVLSFYTRYTESQEAHTRAMQRLRHDLRQRYGQAPAPRAFRDEFRRLSLPLMKYTNILSFNWRSITLFTAILCRKPWLYFIAELTVFNAIAIYMNLRHESICRKLSRSLDD